jgi:hypothetical protein
MTNRVVVFINVTVCCLRCGVIEEQILGLSMSFCPVCQEAGNSRDHWHCRVTVGTDVIVGIHSCAEIPSDHINETIT